MTTQPRTKFSRRIYEYCIGELSFLLDAAVEAERYQESNAWSFEIEKHGFTGWKDAISMQTFGGLPARVYRRMTPGQARDKKSLFAPYDFVVDVDSTYMVVVRDLPNFLRFSKEYLIQPQNSSVDVSLYGEDNLQDALWSIGARLSEIDGTIDKMLRAQ